MNDDSTTPIQPSGQQVPQSAANRATGLTHGMRTIEPLAHDDSRQPEPASPVITQPLPSSTPEPVRPQLNVAALYPAVPEHNSPLIAEGGGQTFLTGSQLPVERPKIPLGVYVIAGLNIVSLVAIFLDDYHAGTWYTITMLLNLVFAVGLLLRQDMIRKLYIALCVLSVGVVVLAFIGIANTRDKLQALRANYDATVSSMDTTNLSPEQTAQMKILPQLMEEIQKKNDKLFMTAYIRLGAEAVVAVVCIVYLTRPKVRAAFTSTQA